ncbi:FAD-binding protein [Janibacter sp. Y6]|uniref:FAD-binding oxidoreductase n=1 Tax=Janibacter sp. Y6 TaxID=2913552 RepID=UPI0034A2696B
MSALSPETLERLVAALPEGVVATRAETLEKYRHDGANDPTAQLPLACVRAESTDHVVTTMRWATEHRIAVVPRGAGTGLSGGASGQSGAITLSTERMRAVEVDPASRTVVVQPGLLNAEVKAAVAEHGLWYPPDPSSVQICSIGGNLATNAGGLCCVKYGVTADYVLGLEVVLADGTVLRLGGRHVKDVAGLSLMPLFVGSEGTLGIITSATLRLVPAQRPAATLVATFPTVAAAADAVVRVGRDVQPSMLELLDQAAINAVEDYAPMGLDRDAGALLLAQSDAPGAARAAEVELVERAFEAAGALEVFSTDDVDEGELFIQARRLALPALEQRGRVLLEDVGAAVPLLPDLLARIEAVAARHGVAIPVIAHAGDGNTHPIIVVDTDDPDGEAKAQAAFVEVMAAAVEIGGTITGEHGIGRLKRDALPTQLGPEVMTASRRVKDALDPLGLLNPGVLL